MNVCLFNGDGGGKARRQSRLPILTVRAATDVEIAAVRAIGFSAVRTFEHPHSSEPVIASVCGLRIQLLAMAIHIIETGHLPSPLSLASPNNG